jgi:hypothetical protein
VIGAVDLTVGLTVGLHGGCIKETHTPQSMPNNHHDPSMFTDEHKTTSEFCCCCKRVVQFLFDCCPVHTSCPIHHPPGVSNRIIWYSLSLAMPTTLWRVV